MTRPIIQDVIAHDKASKTYSNVGTSVDKLARTTTKSNDTIHRSAKKAADANDRFAKVSSRAYATTSGHVKALAVVSSGAFLAIGTGAILAGKSFVTAAISQQKANRQTAAVIKSTGGAANVTAKQIGDLSSAISAQTGIQDDLIQKSANMLLTFTNIHNAAGKNNDIFNQATKVVTDMSVAIGQDSTKSAIQLGKALNDPIKGVGSLMRVGVTFTDAQKKQIKSLTEHGHLLDAQKIILKELTKEFGGSAAAQATAGEKMAAAWDNVKESIGNLLLPVLTKVANWFIKTGLPAIQRAITVSSAWIHAHWSQISATFQAVWLAVQVAVRGIATAITWLRVNVITPTVNWIRQHWPEISAAVKKSWTEIKPALQSIWTLALALWKQILQPLVMWVHDHWHQISNVIKVVAVIVGVWLIAMARSIRIFAAVVTWMVNHVWGPQFRLMLHVITGIAAAVIRIFNGLKAAWNAVWASVKLVGGHILDWFTSFPGKLKAKFVNPLLWLYQIGRDILHGLWNGISALGTWLMDKIKSIIPGWIKTALGINSPPKWAVGFGGWIAKGLAHGITHNFPHFLGNLTKTARDIIGAGFGKDTGMVNTRGVSQAVSRAMELTGVPSTWFDPIMRRIRFESGGNPKAINTTDINAQRGDPSRGLMQTIMATFAAYHLRGTSWDIYDPVANVAAAIRYIESRYGSIFAIDPPIQGYEKGTSYVPKTGLALLHQGERVVPAAENRDGGGGVYINEVHVHGVQSTSELWKSLQMYAKRNGSIKLSGITA